MPRHHRRSYGSGQELDFRIKVTGPAAWGMTDRPDLGRYARLGLGLRIEPKPDETTDEPPVRTFVYRLRPTHAGEAVLPPVAIAAFDPSLSRYVTHVTAGVPIRVVAVPSFDPATFGYDPPSTAISRPVLISLIVISLATLSFAVLSHPATSAAPAARARARPVLTWRVVLQNRRPDTCRWRSNAGSPRNLMAASSF